MASTGQLSEPFFCGFRKHLEAQCSYQVYKFIPQTQFYLTTCLNKWPRKLVKTSKMDYNLSQLKAELMDENTGFIEDLKGEELAKT